MRQSYHHYPAPVNPESLKPGLKTLYDILCETAGGESFCYVHMQDIANRANLCLAQAYRSCDVLKSLGLIHIDKRRGVGRRITILRNLSDSRLLTKVQPGYIYMIECDEFCKIGKSARLSQRVRDISMGMPFIVRAVYAIETPNMTRDERKWHRAFKLLRINGEWFRLSEEDRERFRSQAIHVTDIL